MSNGPTEGYIERGYIGAQCVFSEEGRVSTKGAGVLDQQVNRVRTLADHANDMLSRTVGLNDRLFGSVAEEESDRDKVFPGDPSGSLGLLGGTIKILENRMDELSVEIQKLEDRI